MNSSSADQTADIPERQAGLVVRLFQDRGFGFVKAYGSGEEFFFHFKNCVGDAWKRLEEGTAVTFLPTASEKGNKALFVKVR